MHNVKRLSAEKRAAQRKENEERAATYRGRSQAALERRKAKLYDDESLAAVARVVQENPDFATLWNFRREVLQNMHPDAPQAAAAAAAAAGKSDEGAAASQIDLSEPVDPSEARRVACAAEFQLTQECLGINPKSYPVWYHRQWVLEWGRCAWQWPVEIKLTGKLLALDDRNFHCWTYRRFVVRVASVAAEAELAFTTQKIEANFSNYSAWHYRSKLLPTIYQEGGGAGGAAGAQTLGTVLRDELQLVRNAFFTAPEDSSAWFYHRWLLAQLRPGARSAAPPEEYHGVVREELGMVEELLELEPGCKWVLAAAAFLGRELDAASAAAADARLTELQAVDPLRARFYADQRRTAPATATPS